MTEEESNLNQEDGDSEELFGDEDEDDETPESNGNEGEDSEVAALNDSALTEYNQRVGKNYKSWDEVEKSEKERDKEFVKKGTQKQASVVDEDLAEEVLLTKHPEAEAKIEEIREQAKLMGVSVLKLFRESTYYQNECKAIAAAKKSEEETKAKIGSPTGATGAGGSLKFSQVDLDNPDHVKWVNATEERSQKFQEWMAANPPK